MPRWPEVLKLGGVEDVFFEFFKGTCAVVTVGFDYHSLKNGRKKVGKKRRGK